MKTYKHILLATSLAEESDKIADKTAHLANMSKAKFSIVHIIEAPSVLYGGGEVTVPLSGKIEESIQILAQNNLAKLGKRLGVPPAQQHIEIGAADEKLIKLTTDLGVDLLVIGSHKHHGLALVLGSTANTMMHKMPCDILAMHV